MAKMEYELDASVGQRRSSAKGKAKEKHREGTASKWIRRSIPILFAAMLIAAGFLLAQSYIERVQQQLTQIQSDASALNRNVAQVQSILAEHMTQIEQLHAKFETIDSQMQAVTEELSLAGDSLQSNDATKQALSQRIADLSKELDGLKKLIAKLEEAARVY